MRKLFQIAFLLIIYALPISSGADVDRDLVAKAYTKGLELKKEKKYNEAIDAFYQAISNDRHFAEAYLEMGHCYYNLGQKTRAFGSYHHYLTLNPNDVRTNTFAESLRGQISLKEITLSGKGIGSAWVRGWQLPAADARGYNVYFSRKSGGKYALLGMVKQEVLLIHGVEKNTTLYFVVTAISKDHPPVESKQSPEFSITSY